MPLQVSDFFIIAPKVQTFIRDALRGMRQVENTVKGVLQCNRDSPSFFFI